MNAFKNAKFLIIFGSLIFQILIQFAVADQDIDLTREKAIALELLQKKFDYTARFAEIYGFAGKIITPEDVEILKDLTIVMKKINHPRSLHQYTSISINTQYNLPALNNVMADDKSAMISIFGKKLNQLEIVKLFSIDPANEESFQIFAKEKIEKSSKLLTPYMGPELLETLITLLKIKCNSPAISPLQIKEKLLDNDFQAIAAPVIDQVNLAPYFRAILAESFKIAKEKEKNTLRFQHSSVDNISLYFQKNNIDVALASRDTEETATFSLSENCEVQNLMVRAFNGKTVKSIFHFDKNLTVTKKVFNNQERVFSKHKRTTRSTPIATLDSGLDYNHPAIVENLLDSTLNSDQAKLYEESKKDFINDFEITKELQKKQEAVLSILKLTQSYVDSSKLSMEKEQNAKLAFEKKQEAILKQTQSQTDQLNEVTIALKPLLGDKFIAFKPAKAAQITALRNKISDINASIESLLYEQANNSNMIAASSLSLEKRKATLYTDQIENNKHLNEMANIQKEKASHQKMLDIFTRGVTAWNFYDDNDTPSDFWDSSDSISLISYDHGTHVAGIILHGAEDELTIFPMRYPKQALFDYDEVKARKVYQAIELAHNKGIRIVNISMGSFAESANTEVETIRLDKVARDSWKGLERAIKDFPDMLFVCASGNNGKNTDEHGNYPSGFDLPNILSVGAVDNSNILAKFSNYGKKTVDIAAPGVDIISLEPNAEVGMKSGTSMAAPFATRVAGRIKYINPDLSPEQIKEIIGTTVIHTRELEEKTFYGGVINERAAVLKACRTINQTQRDLIPSCK